MFTLAMLMFAYAIKKPETVILCIMTVIIDFAISMFYLEFRKDSDLRRKKHEENLALIQAGKDPKPLPGEPDYYDE